MISLLPAIALFMLLVFLFFREARLDQKRWAEEDRLGDEHVMREINKFLRDKNLPTVTQNNTLNVIDRSGD